MRPLPEALATAIDEIRSDRTSGAAALARRAAQAVFEAAPELDRLAPEERFLTLVEIARRLVLAQPAMAPLVNLADMLLRRTDAIGEAASDFLARLEAARESVARHGAALIADGATILTHSLSQAVLDALLTAHASGKRFLVHATESRPQREGVWLARRLGEAGIAVRLIIDAAVFARLPNCTLALTGADAISSAGVVNKTGTALLALAARTLGKPFYVLCGTVKFLPAGYRLPPEPAKPAGEILPEALPNVTAENFYFETTPLELVSGVLTEEGLLEPEQVRARLGARSLHPSLLTGTGS
jgi:translation initiation factor 2B subunit (eIF-2B alpha/beta/delta family)